MKVYKKKPNGRYEELGHEFNGFPADGLWLVWDGRNNCIARLDTLTGEAIKGEMPEMMRVHQIIEDALMDTYDSNKLWNVADKAKEITQKLFIKEK